MNTSESWQLAERSLSSRILLGSAHFPSQQILLDSIESAGSEIVTVALRRVDPGDQAINLYQVLQDRGVTVLPNTAGCFTAKDAILTAELAREALQTNWIKLEVIADDRTLLPDAVGLLEASKHLTKAGFVVLPYTNDDPIMAQRLQDLGCAAVMPLAAPIGTGLGIRNPHSLELLRKLVDIPVIVDAGLGTASDVAIAFELGCDAVLVNTAIARARNPALMARAMRHAALAGQQALAAGRMPKRTLAQASSRMDGRLQTVASRHALK